MLLSLGDCHEPEPFSFPVPESRGGAIRVRHYSIRNEESYTTHGHNVPFFNPKDVDVRRISVAHLPHFGANSVDALALICPLQCFSEFRSVLPILGIHSVDQAIHSFSQQAAFSGNGRTRSPSGRTELVASRTFVTRLNRKSFELPKECGRDEYPVCRVGVSLPKVEDGQQSLKVERSDTPGSHTK
ncbi:MAG: hypothetical protein ACRER2_11055 [Methylococcales bacterium]